MRLASVIGIFSVRPVYLPLYSMVQLVSPHVQQDSTQPCKIVEIFVKRANNNVQHVQRLISVVHVVKATF